MSPRVTDAHVEARRRAILDAAFRCFARDGLHGATMQDIAGAAGLSTGTLYGYFDDKEALVRALAAQSAERRMNTFANLEPGKGAPALADAVYDLMGNLDVEEAETSVRLDVRLWAEMLDRAEGREIILEAFGGIARPVARFVRAEREDGRIRPDVDPEAVGRLVVSLLAGLELQRAYEPGLDLEAYRTAARALLAGRSLGSPKPRNGGAGS